MSRTCKVREGAWEAPSQRGDPYFRGRGKEPAGWQYPPSSPLCRWENEGPARGWLSIAARCSAPRTEAPLLLMVLEGV